MQKSEKLGSLIALVLIGVSIIGISAWQYSRPKMVIVSYSSEVKPLQDTEVVDLNALLKKWWPDYALVGFQCNFGSKPKCVAAIDAKDQKPYRLTPQNISELSDSIGEIWTTEDLVYLSSVTCNMQPKPQCQAYGFVQKTLDDVAAITLPIVKPKKG